MQEVISTLFHSESRVRVLVLLWQRTGAASLRELAELSGCALCAISASLHELEKEKLVTCKRMGKESWFRLNRKHRHMPEVQAICEAVEQTFLARRAASYGTRPLEVLRFCSDTLEYLNRVRELNSDHRRAS